MVRYLFWRHVISRKYVELGKFFEKVNLHMIRESILSVGFCWGNLLFSEKNFETQLNFRLNAQSLAALFLNFVYRIIMRNREVEVYFSPEFMQDLGWRVQRMFRKLFWEEKVFLFGEALKFVVSFPNCALKLFWIWQMGEKFSEKCQSFSDGFILPDGWGRRPGSEKKFQDFYQKKLDCKIEKFMKF